MSTGSCGRWTVGVAYGLAVAYREAIDENTNGNSDIQQVDAANRVGSQRSGYGMSDYGT